MANALDFVKNINIAVRGTAGSPEINISATGTFRDAAGATPTLQQPRTVKADAVLPWNPATTLGDLNTAIVSALEAAANIS